MRFLFSLPLSLLCLSVLSASALPQPHPQPISVPLRRRAPKLQHRDVEWARQQREALIAKYAAPGSARRKRQSGGTGIQMGNVQIDGSYVADINVGTPPQTLSVVLDSGSSDLWLIGSQCGQSCGASKPFEERSSTSFKESEGTAPVQLSYGSGNAAGPLVEDVVSIAGYTVNPQEFVDVTQLASGLVSDPSVTGLLGLAWPAIAVTQATPLVNALIAANQLPNPVMGFFLTRYDNDPQAQTSEPGGVFTLGGVNSSLYTGSIEYHAVQQLEGIDAYWTLLMSSMVVGSTSVPLGTQNSGIIDTGTTLIGGPTSLVEQIYASIPGSQVGTGNLEGYYTFPCSDNIAVTLNFGGQDWQISSADFAFAQASANECVGAFMALDLGQGAPSWILGDTFLKNVYTVLDVGQARIGIAALSSEAIAQDPEGLPSGAPNPSAAVASTLQPTFPFPTAGASGTVLPTPQFTIGTGPSSSGALHGAQVGVGLTVAVVVSVFMGAMMM